MARPGAPAAWHVGARTIARTVVAVVALLIAVGGCAGAGGRPPGPAAGGRAEGLRVAWADDVLSISGPEVPGGEVEVWYLEAYCRSGSTDREWGETTLPHRTELVEAAAGGRRLRLRCRLPVVEGAEAGTEPVVVVHEIVAGEDEVSFFIDARNEGTEPVDVQWAQPCVRVGRFTGRAQDDYVESSFIFTEQGLQRLSELPWATEARYRGGQVWAPVWVDRQDVNPRPISRVRPANGLIGCFSADGSKILATAWEPWQELFQGVIVCLHSDFRIAGLAPGESKKIRGKIYIVESDVEALLERYERDFGAPR